MYIHKTDKATLCNGDAISFLKTLPDNSVDLVLTDPPYNIARENNFHTMGRAGIDFGEWDKGFDLFSYINELPRIMRKNGSVIIFNDWKNIGEIAKHCESCGFVIKDMIRWEKRNPMPRNKERRYITDFEVAVWVTMPKAKWVFNKPEDVSYARPVYTGPLTPPSERYGHTTPKPGYLVGSIIETHSNPGDVVLDMFMGAGSVIRQAVEKGRFAIGCDIGKCETEGHPNFGKPWADVVYEAIK